MVAIYIAGGLLLLSFGLFGIGVAIDKKWVKVSGENAYVFILGSIAAGGFFLICSLPFILKAIVWLMYQI